MRWYDDGPVIVISPATWPGYKTLEKNLFRTMNREAKCLKKLIMSLSSDFDNGVGWTVKKERLTQLGKLDEGVTFVVGTVQTAEGSKEELRMQVEKVVEELNARKA